MQVTDQRITLNRVRLYAYHGVLPQERKVGGWYEVTLSVDYPFLQALESDSVADTVNYASLIDVVLREMAVSSQLLEHVAGRICRSVIEVFPKTVHVSVEITKLNPPMGCDTQGASVLLGMNNSKSE